MRRTLRSLFVWTQFVALAIAGAVFVSDALAQARTVAPEIETCKNCHADRVESYKTTKHGQAGNLKGPDCVSCHGAGALEHARAGGGRGVGGVVGFNNKSVPMDQKSSTCLGCHQGAKRTHWQMSAHASRDVGCTSCHQTHTPNDKTRDKVTQSEVCFACHKEQRIQVSRQSRHPVQEGKVACSDCHNPHGSPGEKMMVRDSVNDTCYTCHMEKRGPFVRTHQPVQENCAICHNPHGSTNDNLLKTRAPFLCQQCHEPTSHRGNFASIVGGSPGGSSGTGVTLARSCMNCHTNIHGTNNPRDVSNERTFRR